jgi:MFS family permease
MSNLFEENKRFLGFMAGRLLAAFGDQMLMFAIPLLVYKTTGSATKSGLAFAIEWTPRLLSLPLAGSVADRLGGVRLFMRSDLVRALACLTAFLFLQCVPGIEPFYVLAALAALAAFFFAQSFVALEALVPKMVANDKVPNAQAMLQMCDEASYFIGPLAAGVIVLWLPCHALIVLAGLFFALSSSTIALVGFHIKSIAPVGTEVCSLGRDIAHGVTIVLREKSLVILVLLSILINAAIGTSLALNPIISTGVFGVSDQLYGSVNSSVGLVAIICLVLIPWLRQRFSLLALCLGSLTIMCTGGAVAATAPQFWLFVLGMAMMIGGVNVFNVYMRSERARLIPSQDLGKAIGVMGLLALVSLPVSGLLVAYCSESLGPQRLLLIVYATVGILIAGLLVAVSMVQQAET